MLQDLTKNPVRTYKDFTRSCKDAFFFNKGGLGGNGEKSLRDFYDPEEDEEEAEIARLVENRLNREIQEQVQQEHEHKRFVFLRTAMTQIRE